MSATRYVSFDAAQALSALDALAAHLGDLRPALQEVGEYLIDSTKRRFASGTAPDGSRWAPNSPVTLARYGALFKGKGAAAGKRALIGETRRLSTEIQSLVSRDAVTVGSALVYAGVQQFGAARRSLGPKSPWGDIPARPFLGLSAADQAAIVDIVTGYLRPD
jgi:phage virion morphogenesis protein